MKLNANDENFMNVVYEEKEKITLKYKQKLNNIKQHYGVEFEVETFTNYDVKNIIFVNLKYKNLFTNVSVIYNGKTGKFDYIDYDFLETRSVKNLNHKRLISNLEKEYKLNLIVAEIYRLNENYVKELSEINNV